MKEAVRLTAVLLALLSGQHLADTEDAAEDVFGRRPAQENKPSSDLKRQWWSLRTSPPPDTMFLSTSMSITPGWPCRRGELSSVPSWDRKTKAVTKKTEAQISCHASQ